MSKGQIFELDSAQFVLKKDIRPREKVDLLNKYLWFNSFEEPRKCINYALLAVEISERNDYLLGKAESYKNLGILYTTAQSYQNSIDALNKAISIYTLLGDSNQILSIRSRIAINLIYQGHFNKAFVIILDLINYQSDAKRVEDSNKYNHVLAWLFFKIGDYETSKSYYDKEISGIDSAVYQERNLSTLSNYYLNELYRSNRNLNDISKYMYLTFCIILDNNPQEYKKFKSQFLVPMMRDLIIQEKFKEAKLVLYLLKKYTSLHLNFNKFDDLILRYSCHLNEDPNNWQDQLYQLNKVLIDYQKKGVKPRSIAFFLTEKANIYTKRQMWRDAYYANSEACDFFTRAGFELNIAESKIKLAEIGTKLNINPKYKIQEAVALFQSSGSILRYKPQVLKIIDIFQSIDDYSNSIIYYKKYITLSDSLNNQNKYVTTYRLQNEFTLKQQRTEKALLMNENKLKTLEIGNQESKLRLLIIALLASLISAGLVIILLYFKNKSHQELLSKNEMIHRQTEELRANNEEIIASMEELTHTNQQLESLHEDRKQLLGILSHDLRSPLNRVMGLISIIEMSAVFNNEIQDYFNKVKINVESALNLMSKMLKENELESSGVQAELTKMDLVPILDLCKSNWEESAARKRITMISVYTQEPIMVVADKELITYVFDNIVSNAVKFSPVDKSILIVVDYLKDYVRVGIQDKGPGLTNEDKESLFKKFAKMNNKPTGGETSTGLGLFIVKNYMKAMHGDITCDSEPEKGATFWIKIKKGA